MRQLYFSQQIKYTYGIEQTQADVIIVGSSRAQNHYVPSIFTDSLGLSCFNMGSGGQNIYYDYGIIKSVLARYSPKIVILDLMGIDIEKTDDNYNTDKLNILLPYYKDNESIKEVIALRGPIERFKLLSRIYPYNSEIFTILYAYLNKDRNSHFVMNGYIPLTGKIQENFVQEDYLIKANTNEVDSLKVRYVEKTISLCKSKGVRIILITSPWYYKDAESFQTVNEFSEFGKKVSN